MDLAEDTLRRDIPRYQKQQFVHVLLNSRSKKFHKFHSNAPAQESFFQPETCNFIEKETSPYIFSPEFGESF